MRRYTPGIRMHISRWCQYATGVAERGEGGAGRPIKAERQGSGISPADMGDAGAGGDDAKDKVGVLGLPRTLLCNVCGAGQGLTLVHFPSQPVFSFVTDTLPPTSVSHKKSLR